MSESRALVRQLLVQIADTVDALLELGDEDLARDVNHGCAMQGGLRRLLVHNAEHDRAHAGAVSTARSTARAMQESELARLLRDWLRERAELAGQLLNTPDELLDAKAPNDEWSVRQHAEHVLYWERDSIAAALRDLTDAPHDAD